MYKAQFFEDNIPEVVEQLAAQGTWLVIAGLDLFYVVKLFGAVLDLLVIAYCITKVHAICVHCGDLASHSHRTVQDDALVMLGEKESYIPLCRMCFVKAVQHSEVKSKENSK